MRGAHQSTMLRILGSQSAACICQDASTGHAGTLCPGQNTSHTCSSVMLMWASSARALTSGGGTSPSLQEWQRTWRAACLLNLKLSRACSRPVHAGSFRRKCMVAELRFSCFLIWPAYAGSLMLA